MNKKPRINPATGEVTMGTITFQSKPLPSHQCFELGSAQIIARQLLPEAATAAPHSPPINAWLELEGRPSHQVSKFQMIAANRAQIMIPDVRTNRCVSTRPEEIVLATAVPQSAPSRLVQAASTTAWRG